MNEQYDDLDELPAPPRKDIPEGDRELLELAARALGAGWVEEVDGEGYLNLHFTDGSTIFAWNPLQFHNDTFELMVAKNIEVRFHLAGDTPSVTATCAADTRLPVMREPWGSDKDAATCRAIVRAAAEIERRKSS